MHATASSSNLQKTRQRKAERERERVLAKMEAKIVRRRRNSGSAMWKPDRGEADAPAPCAAIDLCLFLIPVFQFQNDGYTNRTSDD